MSTFAAYLWIVLGVIVAVVLPVLMASVRKEFPRAKAPGMPPWLKRYLILGVFSLVVGVATLAIWRAVNPDALFTWHNMFLVGFGWESAIEKFLHPKAEPEVAPIPERAAA